MSDSVKVYPNKERIAPGEHASPGMLRSCPPGLQGILMMLIASAQMFALRASDVLGSWTYGLSRDNGFLYCVIAMTAVYALILPLILLVPKELVATADGKPNPVVEAEVIAEIGETESAV
jgi:hypothetical protein